MSKDKKEKELSDRFNAIAKVMSSHLKKEDDVGIFDRAYLKEVFTPETVREGSKLNLKLFKESAEMAEMIIGAAKLLGGKASIETLRDNEDYSMVRTILPLYHDSVEFKTYRSKMCRNPKSGETFEVKGAIRGTYKKRGLKDTGQTGIVDDILSDYAEEMLG